MARASKKEFIVETATGVFLANGYKGTSIDRVVAACQVSKPTVYNHFPDKSMLMTAVMTSWLAKHVVPAIEVSGEDAFWAFLERHWWEPETVAMYRLVIGEGRHFTESAQQFWRQFDEQWRSEALHTYAYLRLSTLDSDGINAMISHRLWLSVRG